MQEVPVKVKVALAEETVEEARAVEVVARDGAAVEVLTTRAEEVMVVLLVVFLALPLVV